MCYCCHHLSCEGDMNTTRSPWETLVSILEKHCSVADPEGIPWVWRAALENTIHKRTMHTTLALKLRTSALTVAITHVSTPVSRIRREHGLHARTYYQRHVATIETMSEALLPLQLGIAICYQYESAYFPAPYADNQLLCSCCGPKRSHAFNSAGCKHNNQV